MTAFGASCIARQWPARSRAEPSDLTVTLDKVQAADRFIDVSDYARPVACRITRALVHTPITPLQVTCAYGVLGLIAALLFATGGYLSGVLAGILLLAKSTLDAVDGSLARARQHPSRVGRFADSVCDYLVNAVVFFGLAINGGGPHAPARRPGGRRPGVRDLPGLDLQLLLRLLPHADGRRHDQRCS